MYRLFPYTISCVDKNYFELFNKIINNINRTYSNQHSSEWNYIYEAYFNQQNLKDSDYLTCNCCTYQYCPKHQEIAEFNFYRCDSCNAFVNLCGWCKHLYPFNNYCDECY